MATEKLSAQTIFKSGSEELFFYPALNKNILVDASRRSRASLADETWSMQEFAPWLRHRFKEGIHLIYLVDAGNYQDLIAESPNGSLESLTQLLGMNYCRNQKEALNSLGALNLGAAVV